MTATGSADLAAVARLIGSPARASALDVMLDGAAHSATELAREMGVAASTASSHLSALVEGGLIVGDRVGRHQRFRLAGPPVARALETLAAIAPVRPVTSLRQATKDAGLRFARTCYDHLAGRLGVELTESLAAGAFIRRSGESFDLTPAGERYLGELGIDIDEARARRRAFALSCLDWSERRPHLAGALGATICGRLVELGWIRKRPHTRAVEVTPEGMRRLAGDLRMSL